jgi:hypothetical protein
MFIGEMPFLEFILHHMNQVGVDSVFLPFENLSELMYYFFKLLEKIQAQDPPSLCRKNVGHCRAAFLAGGPGRYVYGLQWRCPQDVSVSRSY